MSASYPHENCDHLKNCPINEQTGDGKVVGRCMFFLQGGNRCPRHGDVEKALEHYCSTGELPLERDFVKD